MKIISKEEVRDYTNAIYTGFAKGMAVGAVASLGLWQAIKTRQIYRTMTATTRTFVFLALPIAFGTTNLEWVSLKFDMDTHKFGEGSEVALEEQRKIDELPLGQKIKYYAGENKYRIITGAWAASMAGSFWWVNRDRYMNKAQKIVQARMYAQSITIALLLGSMLLSVNTGGKKSEVINPEYTWESIAAREEEREKAAGLSTRLPTHAAAVPAAATEQQ